MSSKTSDKNIKPNQFNPKSLQSKKIFKKMTSLPNHKKPNFISTGEQEFDSQSLTVNKSQISDKNILFGNINMIRIKTYEIQSYEQVIFLLSFKKIEEKMKIPVIQKDSFPQNRYENYYSLKDFIAINKMINIFYNIVILIIEIEQLIINSSSAIEQKGKNILCFFINFKIDLLDKIEILLPINVTNNSKNNEIVFFLFEKIDNIGNLLQNIEEINKTREIEIFPDQKNENNKVEQNENNSVQNNNLEEMKVALKLKTENKIKNNNDNKNINEETKVEKRREEKRREEKRRENL